MNDYIVWQGRKVPFREGDTVAAALMQAGIVDLGAGTRGDGHRRSVFCGIGQCQGCLVRIDGRVTEACLLPCVTGMALAPETGAQDD